MKFLTELKNNKKEKDHYFNNINEDTLKNKNYRNVLFTGNNLQLVTMSLRPEEEIGMETHENGDQFIRIEKGKAKIIIDGKTYKATDDDAIIIPQGKEHNVINVGEEELKLYALYAPPEHDKGTLQKTKPQ